MKRVLAACGTASAISIALFAVCGRVVEASDDNSRAIDVITARRVMMSAIGRNMDELNAMAQPGTDLEPAEAGEHADNIATMLGVFPHLFPADSNIWSKQADAENPAQVSLALPFLWENFDDFYAEGKDAAATAFAVTTSSNIEEFRQRVTQLQAACDSCHAQFRREEAPYVIPIPPAK